MYYMLQDELDNYVLINFDEKTSSGWHNTENNCIKFWRDGDISSWPQISYEDFDEEMNALLDYIIIDRYLRINDEFIKITKEAHPEYYL